MHEPREDAPTHSIPGARYGRLRLLALAVVAVLAPAAQGQPTPPCSADLDWDGTVSGNDLGLLLGSWGHVVAAPTPDIDGNGIVDSQDMGALLGGWGSAGPGDLDGDGTVGGSDLGILLNAWGEVLCIFAVLWGVRCPSRGTTERLSQSGRSGSPQEPLVAHRRTPERC